MTDRPEGTPAGDDRLETEPVASPGGSSVATAPEQPSRPSLARQAAAAGRGLLLPFLAIVTAFLIGGFIVVLSDAEILALFGSDPGAALGASVDAVVTTYRALLTGAIGDPSRIADAVASGDTTRMLRSLEPISFTLRAATPLILTGLAVALGFRAGLFNIGAEGQLYIGGIFAVVAGIYLAELPFFLHIPLAVGAGFLGGALWGFIPGLLKARTGAHEVIVTIMLNYVAYRIVDLALVHPIVQLPGRDDPISRPVTESARLPALVPGLSGVHWGFVIALAAAAVISWLLFRSTKGFEFRAVGLNPSAARYAGMKTGRTIILAMVISGGLAGLAGTTDVLGSIGRLSPGFSPGYGFDAIALALLGRSRPAGVVAAAILFGALRAGATPMQAATGIPIDLVVVIQALVIMFVAAPALVRGLYRIKSTRVTGTEVFSKGWGS
jgi:general nucleoside transport system permease protein